MRSEQTENWVCVHVSVSISGKSERARRSCSERKLQFSECIIPEKYTFAANVGRKLDNVSCESSGSVDLNLGQVNSVSNTSAQVKGRGFGPDDDRNMFPF